MPSWLKSPSLSDREDRILVEQLRLIYACMTVTVLPMFPAIFVLVWTLIDPANQGDLLAWTVLMSLTNVYFILDARRRLASGLTAEQAPALVLKLLVAISVGGAAWGALAFGALGESTAVGDILVIGVLAGILGGSVGLLAPMPIIFIAFSVPLVGLTAAKLWQLGDPAYSAFGVISILYLGTLIAQTHISSRTTRAAIELRFENLELVRDAEAARRDAEHANLAKSKFLAAASHDLRQPIHAQGLFLDVLARTPLNAQQQELVSNISATSSASADMLNTLLDFSRIEAGVVKPHNVPFDLQTLLNKIENDLAPQADAKGLVYRTRETNLTIDSDAALVEMILRNLVSNAIRYTEPVKGRGGVLVACRRRGTESTPMAVVQVWDTGIGIAPENCLDIFKEFHQLGNPERDRRKGLGLGLAIADGLAKTLGHRLGLASVPGRGSVFKLTLPMTQAPAVSTDMAAPQMTGQLQGAHVLVIDDDETVLTGMAQLLQSWGCRVDMASSISSALEHATRQAPQAIVSDYRLRGQQTGAQAIAAVRESLCLRIPALMVTGDTAPERLREALASGVPLLHKPMAPGQLYQALTGLLRG